MHSLSYAIEMANAIERQVNHQLLQGPKPTLGAEEATQARAAKEKTMATLKSTIKQVQSALHDAQKVPKPSSSFQSRAPNATPVLRADGDNKQAASTSIKQGLVSDKMKAQVATLRDMTDRASPIIDVFNKLSQTNNLDRFSAMLNSVPVIGLKGTDIMFTDTKLGANPGDIVPQWSFFSKLPQDASIDSGKALHFFPFNGNFYVSVGKDVWRKNHRSQNDDLLKQATDNWPMLYESEWSSKIADFLPTDNALDVIPFLEINASRDSVRAHIMTLASDSTVHVWSGDDVNNGGTFATMNYSGSTPANAPTWTQMAYSSGKVCAYDNENNTWELTPNFDASSYTIDNKVSVSVPIIELTANETGPIGLQADGWLYKRSLSNSAPSGDQGDTFTWKRYIQQEEVTHLGVASPGVDVDLALLVRILKARYIDAQVSLYPTVSMIKAFGATHSAFLDNLLAQAQAFQAAGTDEAKQDAAQKAGTSLAKHALVWGKMLKRSTKQSDDNVGQMSKQLDDVHSQLVIQLQNLNDTLVRLQAQLSTQKEALNQARAAEWGALGAMLLGLVLVIGGLATGMAPLVLVGGGLFVAGMVTTIVYGKKAADLASDVADTQNQINTITNSINDLSGIVNNFGSLVDTYKSLNEFWGRMFNDASLIATDDSITLAMGMDILDDTSSIDTAKQTASDMADGAQAYLDMLNKQGIQIPDSDSGLMATQAALPDGAFTIPRYVLRNQATLLAAVDASNDALQTGGMDGYVTKLNSVALLSTSQEMDVSKITTATGLWLDVPRLQSAGNVFRVLQQKVSGSNSKATLTTNDSTSIPSFTPLDPNAIIPAQSEQLAEEFGVTGARISTMLRNTMALAQSAQIWKETYPQLPDAKQRKEAAQLQQDAIDKCHAAYESARDTNNVFTLFNHNAQDFHDNAGRALKEQIDENQSMLDSFNERISGYPGSAPWYVQATGIFGGISIVAWLAQREDEKNGLVQQRDQAESDFGQRVAQLQRLADSGPRADGSFGNWSDAVESVSLNLGNIADTLFTEKFQLWEDPDGYAYVMRIEWAKVLQSAQLALEILGFQPPAALAQKHLLLAAQSDKSVNDQLVTSLRAPDGLSKAVSQQSSNAIDCFDRIQALLQLPHTNDIVAYWGKDSTERNSLRSVIFDLQSQYTGLLHDEYNTILAIWIAAQTHAVRIKNAASGNMSIVMFVKQTQQTITFTSAAATKTSNRYDATSQKFQDVLKEISDNIDAAVAKIDSLGDQIHTAENKLRDQIMWVAADAIALTFASAALAASFGVFGPVLTAVALATKLGLTATATAASIKLALDSLSLNDAVSIITGLKNLRSTLSTSAAHMQAVKPAMQSVVASVDDIQNLLLKVQGELQDQMLLVDTWKTQTLDDSDFAGMRGTWDDVAASCQEWLDVYNAQGFSIPLG